MDRRQFILAATALAAACSRQQEPPAADVSEARRLGLQLYTVRELMAEDVAATLQLVAGTGFREVEFAGYFDLPPEEMLRYLLDAGLEAPSTHVGYDEFTANVTAVIEHALAMGHRFVVVPAVPDGERATLDDYRRHAENFDRWAEACSNAGLRFGYHNHAFEFEEIDGQLPYDLLLSQTDPKRVQMELDLAWARGGNADPLLYFEAWPGRFPLIHIKDLDSTGNEADIGTGDVAFARVFAHAKEAGIEHGFVERDHPADVRQSIRNNYAAIQPLWARYMK
jgi:sugar phosphate isomerase/epimerase